MCLGAPLNDIDVVQTIVDLPDGRWRAERVRVFLGPTYTRLRGVQYAEHPVGKLRWKPPVPRISSRTTIQDATSWGASCIQTGKSVLPWSGIYWPNTREECLFLNLWAPSSDKLLPVLFWIHGGSFESGSGAEYNGDAVMRRRQDAIYVTCNYRLGAFGFLGGPAVSKTSGDGSHGNFGLQDTREALNWVRRNIGALGGDATKITIFGESSGSSMIACHMVAPRSFGLFHGAILESGPFDNYTIQVSPEIAFNVLAQKAGCPNEAGKSSDENVMACLRALPLYNWPGLPSLAKAAEFTAEGGYFSPVVDFVELSGAPEVLAATGLVAPVKGIIIGTNANEGRYMMAFDKPLPGAPWSSRRQYTDWLEEQWPGKSEYIQALYPGDEYHGSAKYWMTAAEVYTDSEYLCPARKSALSLLRSKRVDSDNVYVYQFQYEPSYAVADGIVLYWWEWCARWLLPCKAMWLRFGAAHGVEVPLVWPGQRYLNETDAEVSDRMVWLWQQFATNYDMGSFWPRFGLTNATLLLDVVSSVSNNPKSAKCDVWDQIHPVPCHAYAYPIAI